MCIFRKITTLIIISSLILSLLTPFDAFANEIKDIDVILECEDMSLKQNILINEGNYASGGEYCIVDFDAVTDLSKLTECDFLKFFEFDGKTKVALHVRTHTPAGSATVVYRWDNNPWKEVTVKADPDFEWVRLGEDELLKGRHKLQISHKSKNIWFDSMYLSTNLDSHLEITGTENLEPIPEKKFEVAYSQIQKNATIADENGVIIEAEDMTLMEGISIIDDENASMSKAIKCGISNPTKAIPGMTEPSAISTQFVAGITDEYTVYGRFIGPSSGMHTLFVAFGEKADYKQVIIPVGDNFIWVEMGKVSVQGGEKCLIKMHPRQASWTLDQLVAVRNGMIPGGTEPLSTLVVEENILTNIYDAPLYYPPANEHPRVMLRKGDIPDLIRKLDNPLNEEHKKLLLERVNKNFTYNGISDIELIQARLFYHVLYNDEKIARDAIDAFFKMRDWNMISSSLTRQAGSAIYCGALVYDWGYDLLTDEEKKEIIRLCEAWSSVMAIGWPPQRQNALIGHANEAQLLRDILAFAIATYDERPDIYEFVGGRFYTEYVPVRQWLLQGQTHHQGATYSRYRQMWDCFAYKLITAMGAPEPFSGEALGLMDLGLGLYFLKPNGKYFSDGDSVGQGNGVHYFYRRDGVLYASLSKNPYLIEQQLRNERYANKDGMVAAGFVDAVDIDLVSYLIFRDVDTQPKPIEDLALSKYFPGVSATMAARTGWEYGVDSNSVAAVMKMPTYYFGNHQHFDAGNFQIWYKGPLTNDSGIYQGGGQGLPTDKGYNYKSIAHNCILVYDPQEVMSSEYEGIHDGGQTPYNNRAFSESFSKLSLQEQLDNAEELYKLGDILGQEIDPKNPVAPEYTYISGDLTNWYSDKMSEYKRSFMFLNLFDDDVPAALIVFDKVTSSNPSFKKTWVLHGQTQPEINAQKSTWYSNPTVSEAGETFNGKMVVDHLLPKADDISFTKVGGPEDGWCIINGENLLHPATSRNYEENTYRLEVSPKSSNETDYFLNVIQVTDKKTNGYNNVKMFENDTLYGVSIKDRVVYFSKSGTSVNSVEIDDNNLAGLRKYTICNAEPGEWTILADGEEQKVIVTNEGGVLSFEASSGKISAKKIGESDLADVKTDHTKIIAKEESERKIFVTYDKKYIYMPTSPEIVNDKLMVPVEYIANHLNLNVNKEFVKTQFTDSDQDISVSLTLNSDVMRNKNGDEVKFANPVYIKDGYLMVELRTFAEYFKATVVWDDLLQTAHIVPAIKQQFVKKAEGYAKIVNVTADSDLVDGENVIENIWDNIIDTRYSAEGVGRYFDVEFDKEYILENVEIIFHVTKHRTSSFEIYTSSDGINYERIYDGISDGEADGINFEAFNFDVQKLVKTKYIRYVGKGTSVNLWNSIKEIRFKVGEELLTWDQLSNEIKIIDAIEDDGEFVAQNVASNLFDKNSRTAWRAKGLGRYVQFELQDEETLSAVEIIFEPNNNAASKFEIQVSTDGEVFTTVFQGESDAHVNDKNTWQRFMLNGKPAKYVRYIGFGSDIDSWNSLIDVRFTSDTSDFGEYGDEVYEDEELDEETES